MVIFDVNLCPWSGGVPSTMGAVVVAGTQPFAAVTYEQRTGVGAYNAFSRGAQTLFAPSLLRDYWGWHSRLEIQNVGTQQTNVTVSYYPYARSTQPLCTDSYPLAPYRHVEINHGGSTCISQLLNPPAIFSAVITAGQSNDRIVATVDQLSTNGAFQSHNALIDGKTSLLLPFVRNGTGNWGDNWDASITVQNTTGSDNNNVTLWLYDQAGHACGTKTRTLGTHETYEFYSELDTVSCNGVPTDFSGSVVITADFKVAAVANLFNGSLWDGGISYSATEWKGIGTK
jgi:hypothetical protein